MKRDFAQLYSQLELRPDCTLEEFQQAYRRQIAKLHPDKGGVAGENETAGLPDLIGLYTTAARFHRRHGRLPGGRAPRATGRTAPTPAMAQSTQTGDTDGFVPNPRSTQPMPPQPGDAADAPSRSAPLLAGLAIAALLVLALSWDWPASREDDATDAVSAETTHPEVQRDATVAHSERLQLGMDEASVLAIQGKPFAVHDGQWDYGPSWLRFTDGHLADWYSSPLRRLNTASESPSWEPSK